MVELFCLRKGGLSPEHVGDFTMRSAIEKADALHAAKAGELSIRTANGQVYLY